MTPLATHLFECGVDLRYNWEILEHKSSKTTEIYTHASKAGMASIKSPIDTIFKREKTIIVPGGMYIRNADMNELSEIGLRGDMK
jgi:hypothetical protein